VAIEWIQRDKRFALDVADQSLASRWLVYTGIAGSIVSIRYTGSVLDFIYFQF
jgi:hypothetical protein